MKFPRLPMLPDPRQLFGQNLAAPTQPSITPPVQRQLTPVEFLMSHPEWFKPNQAGQFYEKTLGPQGQPIGSIWSFYKDAQEDLQYSQGTLMLSKVCRWATTDDLGYYFVAQETTGVGWDGYYLIFDRQAGQSYIFYGPQQQVWDIHDNLLLRPRFPIDYPPFVG